jgi:hypothetical protein
MITRKMAEDIKQRLMEEINATLELIIDENIPAQKEEKP